MIFEKFIVSCTRDGLVADLVGRFSDVDDGKVLHTDGNAEAEAFGSINLHTPGKEESGSNLDQDFHG